VRSYGQYCPVARAAEVLGDRWTLLVVRDLVEGAHRFGELASGLPSMSRTLLSQRLRSLVTWILRGLRRDALPAGRFLVRFDFRAPRASTIWLLSEDREPSICTADPGFESDLVVTTDLVSLNRIFAGRIALSAALRSGAIALEGSTSAVRGFSRWLGESPFAGATRGLVAKSA
jgi:hypothetical protein